MSQGKVSCRTTSKNSHFRVSLCSESKQSSLLHFPWSTIWVFKQRISKAIKSRPEKYSKSETYPKSTKKEDQVLQVERSEFKLELKSPSSSSTLPSVSCLSPCLSPEGTGGTYIIKSSDGAAQFVFKPLDEEPFAPMNPRGHVGKLGSESFRPGVKSGEAAFREVAAYMLDHSHFSSVPYTVLAESSSPSYRNPGPILAKLGSLQQFMANLGCADNFAPSKFSKDEVHKIGILDIRLLNMDRNTSNLLVGKDMSLIPIDHGMSIPDSIQIEGFDLCWMGWTHSKQPFSANALKFIDKINIEEDLRIAKGLVKNEKCLKNLRVSALLLKKGAAAGLSLFDIGNLLYRSNEDEPSVIEKIINKAEKACFSARKVRASRLRIKAQEYENNLSNVTQDTSTDSEFKVEDLQRDNRFELFSYESSRIDAFDDGLFEVIEREIDQTIASFLNQDTKRLISHRTHVDSK